MVLTRGTLLGVLGSCPCAWETRAGGDDNVDAAELLAESLRSMGHQAETAHGGPAWLGVASRFRPDQTL